MHKFNVQAYGGRKDMEGKHSTYFEEYCKFFSERHHDFCRRRNQSTVPIYLHSTNPKIAGGPGGARLLVRGPCTPDDMGQDLPDCTYVQQKPQSHSSS
jgi:hypothetical protein